MTIHYAFYGTKRLLRGHCPKCKRNALIVDNRFQCCDKLVSDAAPPKTAKRMCITAKGRRRPRVNEQKRILAEQNFSCFYCDRRFNSSAWRNGKHLRLRIHWDHMVPYAYSQNNAASNFVAACHICNGIKSSLIFKTVEEARIHINERIRQKGYTFDVPEVRIDIPRETQMAEVL